MAQLYYRYSTMNAGKSIDVLKIAHNYEEQNKRVLIFTSGLDDRYERGYVASRMGTKKPAILFDTSSSLLKRIQEELAQGAIFCVLIDEAQFLTHQQVEELAQVVDTLHIPVIAYGLKNDFQNNLFEGSRALLIYADKIEEIKTICWFCNKKATMVLRFDGDKPTYTGEQIVIGGNESYLPVCRRCYKNPKAAQGSKETQDLKTTQEPKGL